MNNFNNNYPLQRNQFNPYYGSTTSTGVGTSTNNIVWVQGIEGAKAWQLAPNSMIILLDSEVEGKMYIKVSDNIGMCSLRIFNYTEEIERPSENVTINQDLDLSEYVRKDELNELLKELIKKDEQPIQTAAVTGIVKPQPKVIVPAAPAK